MENLNNQDIDELKLLAKSYFELEKTLDPLVEQLEKIKNEKKNKEKEIKSKNEELDYVKNQIMVLLERNDIGSLQTNKGKFKIHTPNDKIVKYKQKEIRENLARLFTDRLNTTFEENQEIYDKIYNKDKVQQPSQLRIYKPKERKKQMLFF